MLYQVVFWYTTYMRSSVGQKKYTQGKQATSPWRRRGVNVLVVVAYASICLLLLSYANWQQHRDARAQQDAVTALDASIAAAQKERVDTALKLESNARANAATYSASLVSAATANPTGATATADSAICDVTDPAELTAIVNKKHCLRPIDWAPGDLVSIDSQKMRSEAADAMQKMLDTAKQDGIAINLSSGYRSYNDQVATYAYWVAHEAGSAAAADSYSARPGYSEHQTGLAADLKSGDCVLDCFVTTRAYTWLIEHAATYGFIQRYPEDLTAITGYAPEPWHWRYVGKPLAVAMHTKGIETLEAYYNVTGGEYAK